MSRAYGADTVRGYLMFIGPWDMGGPWDPSAIEGVSRFLYRVWTLVTDAPATESKATPDAAGLAVLERKLHQTILKVSEDMAGFRFNTAIASLMELNNWLIKAKETPVAGTPAWRAAIESLLLMMAPIFPHISDELWQRTGPHGAACTCKRGRWATRRRRARRRSRSSCR